MRRGQSPSKVSTARIVLKEERRGAAERATSALEETGAEEARESEEETQEAEEEATGEATRDSSSEEN